MLKVTEDFAELLSRERRSTPRTVVCARSVLRTASDTPQRGEAIRGFLSKKAPEKPWIPLRE